MEKAPELHQGDRTDDWGRFLKSRYKKELGEISRLYPHKRSLLIDYRQIERFGKAGIILADELLENPGKVLEDVWDAIKNNQLIRAKDGKEPKGVNIRFTNLPRKTAIREIRSDDINMFVSVEGILRKTTEVRPRIVEAVFKCPAATSQKRSRSTVSSSSRMAAQQMAARSRNWIWYPSAPPLSTLRNSGSRNPPRGCGGANSRRRLISM